MTSPTESTNAEVASFEGRLLLQEDAEGLSVTLRVTASRVTLFSGRSELGAWPAAGVSITPLAEGRYEFVAEGDLLTFIPSDDDAFSASPLVAALAPLPPPKRWWARRPKEEATEPATPPQFAAERPKRKLKLRREAGPSTLPDHAAEPPRVAPEPKPTPAPSQGGVGREAWANPTPAASDVAPAPVAPPAPDRVASDDGPSVSRRQQAWLAAIDQARQYDLFGLDRVPVTQKMREERDHKHTWDHRVSAGFASQHLCTICGKVRISSRG